MNEWRNYWRQRTQIHCLLAHRKVTVPEQYVSKALVFHRETTIFCYIFEIYHMLHAIHSHIVGKRGMDPNGHGRGDVVKKLDPRHSRAVHLCVLSKCKRWLCNSNPDLSRSANVSRTVRRLRDGRRKPCRIFGMFTTSGQSRTLGTPIQSTRSSICSSSVLPFRSGCPDKISAMIQPTAQMSIA